MVSVTSYFTMVFATFLLWESMDKIYVWVALHQDEKQERLEKELAMRKMKEELLAQAEQD